MKLTSGIALSLAAVLLTLSGFECRAMDKEDASGDEEKLVRPKSAKGLKKPALDGGAAASKSSDHDESPRKVIAELCRAGVLPRDVSEAITEDLARDAMVSQIARQMARRSVDVKADHFSQSSIPVGIVYLSPPAITGYVKHPDGSFSCTKGSYLDRRALAHYEQYPQIPGLGSDKRAIVGGAHLTPQEVFDLDEAAAREEKSSSLFFEPVGHMNTGCVVFNKDEGTKPDHMEDFTEPGVIAKLGLEGRFNNVTFENVPPSLTFNEEALLNAYRALEPGGFFYAFPIPDMPDALQELERRIGSVGFEDVKFSPKSRYFLTHKPPLDMGSVMARKPKGKL